MTKAAKTASALQRVETLLRLGRNEEASRVAGQVIAADPRNSTAWNLRAQALLAQNKHEAGLAAARAAATVDTGDEYPHRLASVALSHLGRRQEAVEAAHRAVTLAPNNWATHHLHGQTLLAAELHDGAQRSAERAIAMAPDRAEVHIGLGAVAAAQGRRDDAEHAFRRALTIDPANAVAQTRLDSLGTRHTGALAATAPAAKKGSRLRGRGRATSETPTPVKAPAATPAAATGDPSPRRAALEDRVGRFLSRVAYLLAVAGGLVIRLQGRGGPGLAVLMLVLPALYAVFFLRGLEPDERAHLASMVGRRASLRCAALLEAVAIVFILGGTVAPSTRPLLSGVAVGAAAVARLLVYVARHHTARESGTPARSLVSHRAMLRLSLVLVALLLAAVRGMAGHAGI